MTQYGQIGENALMCNAKTDPVDIVLATANARFHHASLALRYLMANLGDLEDRACILEATIDERPADIAEKILDRDPVICALAVYVWNVSVLTEVAKIIRAVRPSLKIVLGGPEVSFPDDPPAITDLADVIALRDGELVFPEICADLLAGRTPKSRIISAREPDLDAVALPYHLYTERDIANRTIYVEASRGCPHGCEFCLSSLDSKVRRFGEDRIVDALDDLWNRGARKFKFVDRSLDLGITPGLLSFFLERVDPGLFLHFELTPDRLPDRMFDLIARFPRGSIQLETGVQTFDTTIAERIGRRQDTIKVELNLRRLVEETGAHLHTDLIVGLPGQDIRSIGESFDRLIGIGVHEIQVGILKRLRGAPISRHDRKWEMVYNPSPPYDILRNSTIDYPTMQRLKRFSRYFDLVFNSGNFGSFAPLIWHDGKPFERFMELTDWLFDRTGRTVSISLDNLSKLLFEFVTDNRGIGKSEAANAMLRDFARHGRRRFPRPVREHATDPIPDRRSSERASTGDLPARQRRRTE